MESYERQRRVADDHRRKREEKMNKMSNTHQELHSWSNHHRQVLPTEMCRQGGTERIMNEGKVTLANGARLFVAMLAVLAALVALQTFGANPAEARCAADADCVDAGQTYYLQPSGTGGARSGTYKLKVGWNCYYTSDDQRFCPI